MSILNLQNRLKTLYSDGKLTEGQLKEINQEFNNITASARLAGQTGKKLGSTLTNSFKSILRYVSVSTIIYSLINAFRQMYNNVYDINTEMTELKKVTNETGRAYEKFLDNSSKKAKRLGTTISDLVSSTADFARLGYNISDAEDLAEVANIYAVVGDDIENIDTATQSIISTMTAFKIETKDAMTIVDKFNSVGNKFAISSGGIGDALQRSASSLAAANNTLDQSIALITAANTVVQDPDSVGTAFKTISMRIRAAKTELEDAGLETEGMAESTAELREEILALSGVDIMLDENTFKSTYEILDELSKKWAELEDVDKANITELLAGKRQGNVFDSVMSNFDIARSALSTSQTSEGSANSNKLTHFLPGEAGLSFLSRNRKQFPVIIPTKTGDISTHDTVFERFTVLPRHRFISATEPAFIVRRFIPSKRTTDIERLRVDQFNRPRLCTLGDRKRLGVIEHLGGLVRIPIIRKLVRILTF